MVARTRRAATVTAGSLFALGSLTVLCASTADPAAGDSICPATLLPGQLCATVDTVVATLPSPTTTQPTTDTTSSPTTDTTSPTTTAPAPAPTVPSLPAPSVPLLPGPTSPVPDSSSPPSSEGPAPAPSTSPGAGDASPASHPATTSPLGGATAATASVRGTRPVVSGTDTDTARGLALPALSGSGTPSSPFVLGPAPLPSTNAGARGISNELAAPLPAARGASSEPGPSLPRPGAPITLAVLLVAGVLGAHGVRWVDRQMATATTTTTTR
jgi:hypothetical protein